MKSIILTILFSLLSLNLLFAQHHTYKSAKVERSKDFNNGNKYQKDFLLFIDILETTHPAFAKKASYPFDINEVKREGYKWSESCSSAADLESYIQPILANLKDGHTQIDYFYDKEEYPAIVRIYDKKVYLTSADSANMSHRKKEIIEINNYPAIDVIDSFKDKLSCENEVHFYRLVEDMFSFRSLWNMLDSRTNELQLTFADSTNITLLPSKNISFKGIRIIPKSYPPVYNLSKNYVYRILEEQSICYLQFNRNQHEKDNNFNDFLREMFTQMESKNIETLVVDVRHNRGGGSYLSDLLISYLKLASETANYSGSVRRSKLYKSTRPKIKRGSTKGTTTIYDIDPIFKGKTIFIQGPRTFSAAGWLIVMARDNNIGTVIGTESSYTPTIYGDKISWKLPNTAIIGTVSCKKFYRPNKENKEISLTPDVLIEECWEDFINGKDPCWEWLVKGYAK